jgi:hypothetical protein
MPRYQWLICGYLICLAQALNAQWTIDPIPGKPPYPKPVTEDTFQNYDRFNRNYNILSWGNTLEPIGRDTIIVEPLKSNYSIKRLPKLKNDIPLLQQKIIYPHKERITGIQGTCLAYIKLSKTGFIDTVWVERGLTKDMDGVVKQAVQSLGRFKPARNKGKAVEAICYYRIWFKLFE